MDIKFTDFNESKNIQHETSIDTRNAFCIDTKLRTAK